MQAKEQSAFLWADYYAKGSIPFFSLQEGEVFRFPSNEAIEYVRLQKKGGWYAEIMPSGRVSKKRWRTGKYTSVIPTKK